MAFGNERGSVLLLTTEYPAMHGGLGTHVFELATALGRAGHAVTVWSFGPGTGEVRPASNVTVVPIAPSIDRSQRKSFHEMLESFNDDLIARARALVAEGGAIPGIVHFHDRYFVRAGMEIGAIFGVPVVGTAHMLEEPCSRWWGATPSSQFTAGERDLCVRPSALIVVSEAMRDIVHSTYPDARGRVHVVHNGLDVRPFRRGDAKPAETAALRSKFAPDGGPIVLFAGRLHPQKGVLAMIAAAAQVVAAVPETLFLVVGSPDPPTYGIDIRNALQANAALKPRLRMLPKVPRHQLAMLYSIATLAIVPSIFEPFGYAAVEAMAAGVPCIASRVGGLAEIIEHDVSGRLVPLAPLPEDPLAERHIDVAAFAAAQIELLQDPATARRLGDAGRQRVAERFTVAQMAKSTEAVYRSLS